VRLSRPPPTDNARPAHPGRKYSRAGVPFSRMGVSLRFGKGKERKDLRVFTSKAASFGCFLGSCIEKKDNRAMEPDQAFFQPLTG
jgi:hypothetical protein